ncbi:unnamed protein product [Oikopleura dioica]|uniref:Uncharacterized protein n=1 Tax=Oikopleura dioica TaxID=34765 RepID=E4Z4P5_OIKDI|nr:unnamed protein product [Oikopleura dioica]
MELWRNGTSENSLCKKGEGTDACFWVINIALPILYAIICAFAIGKTFRDKRALDKLQMAEAAAPGAENPAFEQFDDIEKRSSVTAKKVEKTNTDTEF